jgi:hypothetical protein
MNEAEWATWSDPETILDSIRGANFSWAYEMQVEALDGNVLRLGSDTKPDLSFGPWRDMHGNLWVSNPEGGWTRSI